jgi:hypothetical protein
VTDSQTVTLFGVGVVVHSIDGLVLVGRRHAEASATFACVLVPAEEVWWVVAGVEGILGVRAADAGPRELEPEKFGSFRWIDPARVSEELFPATAALLETLYTR